MISLYRGELHNVSGIPRQWPLPKPAISLSAFRQALAKRDDALRSSSSGAGTLAPCLTRQDTCVSGSHNVSPAHLRAIEAPREETETDIGREGRGESDGHVKVDYMDEDVPEEAECVDDRSKHEGVGRHGSCRSFSEEGYRDGSARMEDSSARVQVSGQSVDGHEPKREPKMESADATDLEDHMDRKERKKRKVEEASLMEARKGKLKVKVKEEVVAGGASGGVERTMVDATGASEEMELDQKVVDKEAPAEGVDNHKGASSEADKTENEGSDAIPELPMSADEGDDKMEANEDEQENLVKVEAPSTPPVHCEEQNCGKPVEGKDHVEEARPTVDPTGDKRVKKAELEAKLKKLTAEKHRLVQMLKQVLTSEKESKKKVQSASQSPSAFGPPSAPGPSSTSQGIPSSTDVPAAPVVQSETTSAGGAEVIHKVDVPISTSHQVRPLRFGRHLTSSRHVQVLSTEEESKKKVQSASQSPPAPGPQSASQAVPSSADVPAAPVVQGERASAGASEVQPSADLEEGELEYARTPSPPSHTTTAPHASSHGTHSHGSAPALGPLLGRQPQHLNQGGSARGNYYQQGLSLPSPSSAAAAAALAGAISPGTGFMPLALGGRPYNQHQMVMQHAAAAIHAQKVAVAAAAAAAGHSHMSPILGGGGPAGAGNGVNNGPPGFGGYGVSPSVHGHHGHMPQGTSPGAGHIASQQGVPSPSLLTTPRGAPGYHDLRNLNPPWNLQR